MCLSDHVSFVFRLVPCMWLKYLCLVARSGCPSASIPSLGVAFVWFRSAPVDLSGPGKVGSAKDWTPGAHTGGCGEALLSGEEEAESCVSVYSMCPNQYFP